MKDAFNYIIRLLRLRRIGVRLTISYGVILILFIGVALVTINQVAKMSTSSQNYAKYDMQRLLTVQELSLEVEGIGIQLLLTFSINRENDRPDYSLIDKKTARLKELMNSLQEQGLKASDNASKIQNLLLNETQKANLQHVIDKHNAFYSKYLEVLDELELNGIPSAKAMYIKNTEPLRLTLLEDTKKLLESEKERFQQRQVEEQSTLKRSQLEVITLSLIAIIFGAVLAFFTQRGVVQPLALLEKSALQIASGNYENKVPPSKTIEVARVGDALNSMSEAIALREQEIEQLAYYDPLTHLPNRTLLLKELEHVDLSEKALLLMDVARLKTVNETLGFSIGDTVILESARRIQNALMLMDAGNVWLAKFTGGMFAILCPAQETDAITKLITEINRHLAEPIRCGPHSVDVNFIYGIATATANTLTLNTLIRNAEVALYAAKAHTQPMVWYSDAQEASRLSHLSLLSDLRSAVQNSELQMWLQPKLELSNMHTYGFEALVRWQHPQRGFISPAEFVPFAERTGYISTVTKWMLERALQTLADWKSTHPELSIAVNVSTNDLRDQDFPDRVRDLIAHYAVDPTRLKLELTESGIMEDPASAIPLLQRLCDTGIGLSIDDFGTGHSSLAYLQKLPVTELKIDRSFIINIDQFPSAQRLVRTIIEMGHGLDLSVIAEGIETKGERDTLHHLGCDSMQGYFASKPLYGDGLNRWLEALPNKS